MQQRHIGLPKLEHLFGSSSQGWQYGALRSEFAYYVPHTLNRIVPAYRTLVQFLKHIVPTYRTRTIAKTVYCTNVLYPYHCKNGVPYQRTVLLSKNLGVSYRAYVLYRTPILALNYSQL